MYCAITSLETKIKNKFKTKHSLSQPMENNISH